MALNVNQKGGTVTPVMNVTPLVDVVLVLLIIFMVVTPLLSKTFWLNLPKKDDKEKVEAPPPDPANTPIVLTVDGAGVVRINQAEVPKAELSHKLSRMLAAQRHKVVYFDARDDAPYAAAVEAMDLARSGGASTIAVMTQEASR